MQFDAARGTWDGDKIVSRYRWVAAGMLAVAGWPQVALAQVSWNLYDQYTKTYTIDYVNTPAVTLVRRIDSPRSTPSRICSMRAVR